MPAVAMESRAVVPFAEARLVSAVILSVESAMTMCGMATPCIGLAGVPSRESGTITGLIGVHGKVSGFITVNLSERLALNAVSGLLQERFDKLSSQVVDGTGEITNIIVGGIKSALSGSQWGFTNITVPSVIVGRGYQIAFAKGVEFLSATFEHHDPETLMLDDRLMQVSLSFMRT